MDIYEFIKNIGNGNFGQVYLVKHKLEDKFYAIKRNNFKDINPRDRENIENEVFYLIILFFIGQASARFKAS